MYPGEINNDVEKSNEALLNPGRRGISAETSPILGVLNGLVIDWSEKTRFIFL